jgi:hypothetical protein
MMKAAVHALHKPPLSSVIGVGLFIVNAKFWSLRDYQWSTSVRKNDPFVEPTLIFPIFCQQSGLSGSKKWFPQSKFSFTSFQ